MMRSDTMASLIRNVTMTEEDEDMTETTSAVDDHDVSEWILDEDLVGNETMISTPDDDNKCQTENVHVSNVDGCCYVAAVISMLRANKNAFKPYLRDEELLGDAIMQDDGPVRDKVSTGFDVARCMQIADEALYTQAQTICHGFDAIRLKTFGGFAIPFLMSLLNNPSFLFISSNPGDAPVVDYPDDQNTRTLVIIGQVVDGQCSYSAMRDNMQHMQHMSTLLHPYHYCGVLTVSSLRYTPEVSAGHILFAQLCEGNNEIFICDSNEDRCYTGESECAHLTIQDTKVMYHVFLKENTPMET